MRVFKNRVFGKWAKVEGIVDDALLAFAAEMESDKAGVSPGKKVFKKRVAVGDRGKRGGGRIIIAFKQVWIKDNE